MTSSTDVSAYVPIIAPLVYSILKAMVTLKHIKHTGVGVKLRRIAKDRGEHD